MKFDMNYIINSSPTSVKRSGLITLEKLNQEKINKKLFTEKKKTEYDEYLAKNSKTEDSFFDWSRTNKDFLKDPLRKTQV
jgi:methionyl-tRNA formyltransferase